MQTYINVHTSFEGTHCWPAAPDEVSWLRNEHYHIFGVTVNMSVEHEDRDVEFRMLQRRLDQYFAQWADEYGICHLGSTSCETLARDVAYHLACVYGAQRELFVTVDEDGNASASFALAAGEATAQAADATKEAEQYEDATISDVLQELADVLEQIFAEEAAAHAADPTVEVPIVDSMNDYQERAYTALSDHTSLKEELMHWVIGLGEEAGEVLSVVKHHYYGNENNIDQLVSELGDVLWYIAAMCSAIGIPLSTVAAYNLAKLQHRYPRGYFDEQRSQERHEQKFSETKVAHKILGSVPASYGDEPTEQ